MSSNGSTLTKTFKLSRFKSTCSNASIRIVVLRSNWTDSHELSLRRTAACTYLDQRFTYNLADPFSMERPLSKKVYKPSTLIC